MTWGEWDEKLNDSIGIGSLLAPMLGSLGTADWVTIGAYFLLLAVAGVVSSRRQADTGDYFLGGHAMPGWAVALSVVATALSAATFIGAPQLAYDGDLTYLIGSVGSFAAAGVVAVWFIPVFYRCRVVTVYELLGQRIGPGAKAAASGVFLVGRVFASGARLFVAAIPLAMILFDDPTRGQVMTAIAVLTVCGVFVTLGGGIRSVIWTDVLQVFVFVGAAVVALIVLKQKITLGWGQIFEVLGSPGGPGAGRASKLTWFDLGIGANGMDVTKAYTLLTALTGLTLLNTAAYGTDHDLTQRLLTCRSALEGSRSMIGSALVGVPITGLFMAVGLGLFVFYHHPQAAGVRKTGGLPVDSSRVFVAFIIRELPGGLKGLLLAGVFAAGLSSFNSALHAMSSSFVNDFYRIRRPGRGEGHYVRVGRAAVCGWGVVLGCFAAVCVAWQAHSGEQLIDFALGVMALAYSGLLAVFATAIFTGRGSDRSAVAALAIGFVVVLAMGPGVWDKIAPRSWAGVKIAFPWRMVVGTAAAFAVCCIGKPSRVATDATI